MPTQKLSGPTQAEIAIVGAGFTGLWAAYFLKELKPEIDIAILEQGMTGYGASGRNAGMISNCIDHTHSLAISHFGQEEAAKLAQLGLKNIDELEAFALDCDLERTGQLFVALTEKHIEDLKSLMAAAESLGIKGYQLFSREEIRQKLNSQLYVGGAFVPGRRHLRPHKTSGKTYRTTQSPGCTDF